MADVETLQGCVGDNEYNGELGVRISAIFVILVGSLFGALFPIFARPRKNRGWQIPSWVFFVCKYFGSGVIVATAFIHLLSPANDALRDECLTGPITEYDWVAGIALMTIFVLFFVELMAMRYAIFDPHGDHGVNLSRSHSHNSHNDAVTSLDRRKSNLGAVDKTGDSLIGQPGPASPHVHTPGEDHLSHSRGHADSKAAPGHEGHAHSGVMEDFTAQMTAIFILEFGVIFHSIFVGLTLAVSGDEFHTLYVVLVFHQTFEGLGLGSRLAITPWPKDRWWIPYVLGTAYALSTPIAIAIGLGLRQTYAPGTQTALIVNGVFDSISAGILIYTGLVELMAHEFMFSEYMRRAKMSVVLGAYGSMCLGAALMAVLGKWA